MGLSAWADAYLRQKRIQDQSRLEVLTYDQVGKNASSNTALVARGRDGNVFGMQSDVRISHGDSLSELRWTLCPICVQVTTRLEVSCPDCFDCSDAETRSGT